MWENLKRTVNNVIKPNDNREITGEKHNNTLSAVINSLGKYSQFAGLAFKNTNPGTPDGPVFYFAAFKGVYINFNRIEVKENEVAILNYNNNKWGKIVIGYSPIAPATAEDIRLTAFIDAVNNNNALKTNFEFKQDSIADVQLPFLHAAVSHIDADGQLIKGKPISEVLIPVPLAEPSIDVDTPGKHGFMSYQDKDLLDSIPNYTVSGKKISENPILTYDDIQGVAYLGEDGKIPSSLLPSYVDDVLEYNSIDNFPLIGEGGKIYLDKKTNLAYRWSGTTYVSISSSIALGETSSTAYAGDKGKKNAEDIADLKTNKADKTSVYTKEEVDYLLEHFKLPDHIKAITFSVNGILLSKNENGDLVIGGNVVVEGGISMYGPGQFGDSIMDYIIVDNESIKIIDGKLTVDPNFVGGGTVKGIKVNGYTYDEVDTNGYITIPDYPTELAWNSITGKPSTFTPSAHTHTIEDITDIANASVSHATTADRLKKEIKIWGQPFDGSTDVEGTISNVDVINMANADTVISLYIKDGVLFLEGDLAVTGGITMYASNGVTSGMIDQVYAVLDPTIFSKQGDYITIKDDIGGGTVKAVKVGSTQYDPDSDGIISLPEFPTATTVEWDNILNKPSSFIPSAHTHPYLPLSGGTLTGALTISAGITSTSAFVNTGDATLKVYSGITTDAVDDGNICLQTSFDETDGQSHTHPINWSERCNLVLQPRGGQVYIGVNPYGGNTSYKLYVNGGVYATSFTGNATTASKWATARTLTISGSVTGSVSIDGSGNVTLATTTNHTHSYLPLSGGTVTGITTFNINNPWLTPSVIQIGRTDTSMGTSKAVIGVTDGNLHIDSYHGHNIYLNFYNKGQIILGYQSGYYISEDGSYYNGTAASANNADMLDGNHASAFATAGHTHSYLPLSGGTITGQLNIDYNATYPLVLNGASSYSVIHLTARGTTKCDIGWLNDNRGNFGYIANVSSDGALTVNGSGCYYSKNLDDFKQYTIYHSGNLNTSVISGLGTLSNNISGNAATATKLQTARTIWGQSFDGTGNVNGNFKIQGNSNTSTNPDIYIGYYNSWQGGSFPTIMSGYSSKWIMHFNPHICKSDSTDMPGSNIRMQSISSNFYDLSVAYDGNDYFRLRYNNNKNIFTATNNGDFLVSGGITMYSDLRKKNILSDEVLSVKEIAAAPLFRYTYKSDNNQYIHVGTSAQYWSGIHEDWFTRKDGEGYYQMELQNLGVAMGISLAREIVKYESKTDKKIRLMKKRINELEARVKELEERRTA